MNLDASEFFPSNETEIRSTTIEEEDLLCAWLKTDHQLATAKSILQEWSTSTTLSSLTHEWSTKHENQPIEQNGFSLVLYNISDLRMHLGDLIDNISASYPDIWTLTGLHSNDEVNYQLVSHFKSRYTIYYQQGSNSFGGVCLAIAREVPHQSTSEVHDANNLIAADVFNSNKKYTVAVVFSPPSEEVPIDILNRLHRYNRNLILIGDLNARHPSWDDVSSNSCGHRLAEWIAGRQDLRIFNSPQPTSTRSQAVIDLIIAPYRISSELAEIDQKMRVTDHYPVHWRLSSFISHSQTECEVKRIDWVVLNCILNLKQNFFFFALSAQMRHDSTGFILVYEAFLVGLQERCTTYRMTQSYRPRLPPYLVNLIQQRRRILCLCRSTRSEEHRNSLFSLNKYIHHELRAVKRAQWQEFCLGLEPKNTQRFWNHSKNLFKKRATRIQAASGREISRTSVATISVHHQRSASVYPTTENENIKRSWEGVEQAAQIDSDFTLRLHPSNIQCAAHREHLSTALETVEDGTPAKGEDSNSLCESNATGLPSAVSW